MGYPVIPYGQPQPFVTLDLTLTWRTSVSLDQVSWAKCVVALWFFLQMFQESKTSKWPEMKSTKQQEDEVRNTK